MSPYRRREAIAGAVAGFVSGLLLAAVRLEPGTEASGLVELEASQAGGILLHLVLATLVGALFGMAFRYQPGGFAATISGGLLLGLLWWIVGSLTLSPLLDGSTPTWALDEASSVFSGLIGGLFFGGLTGLLFYALMRAAAATGRLPPELAREVPTPTRRVVILGGGFGGIAAAQRLEQLFARDPDLEICLVSESNYLLFTPMLAEVASSALEPQHISAPIRASCPRTRFRRARVEAVDSDREVVRLHSPSPGSSEELPYDHLVLALGSVPTYRGLPGVKENTLALKSLQDATDLRNRVIGLLETADVEQDEAERRRMLTFVVVGGGFAGTEMVAELFDLVHIVLRYYPHVPESELRFVLVHSRDRILPEIGPELADYALQTLRSRGIEFVLETRVRAATPEAIVLGGDREIPTRTIVWTAGNQPNPLLAGLGFERNRAGAVLVQPTLQVRGQHNVWAVGDCAEIPDPDQEEAFYPPTAQHALREGKVVGENIAASLRGKEPKPFRFKTIGILVALGHRTAVAEIYGWRFSGLLAWFLWRGIYWSKLPGFEKKVRVFLDWTIELFFARDIVLTDSRPTPTMPETIGTKEPGLAELARDR